MWINYLINELINIYSCLNNLCYQFLEIILPFQNYLWPVFKDLCLQENIERWTNTIVFGLFVRIIGNKKNIN